jgi:hypothetical protein
MTHYIYHENHIAIKVAAIRKRKKEEAKKLKQVPKKPKNKTTKSNNA